MQPDYTIYQIPSFKRSEAYNFERTENPTQFSKIYQELNEIAEELEKCRLRNS